MRIPIFTRRDPSRPLLRKSLPYVLELVAERRADWIDANRHKLGVILNGKLKDRHEEELAKPAGSGFDSSWSIKQSGYAGPLVMQLKGQPNVSPA